MRKAVVLFIILFSCLSWFTLMSCGDKSLIAEKKEPIINNLGLGDQRILVVSHNTLDSNYLEYTLKNHHEYTKQQGYDYWFRNGNIDDGRFSDVSATNRIFRYGLYWQKIAAVEQSLNLVDDNGFKKYDWVVWIDADAFFTNMDKRFESIISQAQPTDYFIIARDYPTSDCVNAGVFLVKNNEDGIKFIRRVAELFNLYKTNTWPEQQAIVDLIYQYVPQREAETKDNNEYQKRTCDARRIISGVHVVPQRTMNSFYGYKELDVGWQAGDFIAHMAGAKDKLSAIKRLMSCMAAKGNNLSGCEPGGTWQEPSR